MNSKTKEACYWMGTPIGDLPRDDLEEAFVRVAGQLREYQSPSAIHDRAVGKVENMKRRLNA